MLAAIFKPSIDNTNVKQCMSHILSKMDYNKYRSTLYLAQRYPGVTRKFVVLEYTQSPSDSTILHAEYVPGTRVSIHNILQHPDFRFSMISTFGNVNFYTRRKQDYSKPLDERLTDTRQLVVEIREEVLNPEDEFDDMPPLLYCGNPSAASVNALHVF